MPDSDYSDYSDPELSKEEKEEMEEEEVRLMSPSPGVRTPTAALYPSVCTSSAAAMYAYIYKVPPEYGLCAPAPTQRAHAPPPGYAAIYTRHFENGLRLPMPPFVVSVLRHYEIALTQLHPNCITILLGFVETCKRASIVPTTALFRHFYRLRRNGKETEGWYTFKSILPKIVHEQTKSVREWKQSFLFFKTAPLESLALSWNYSIIMDMWTPETEKPSEQTVNSLLAKVKGLSKRKRGALREMPIESEEEERMMIGADVNNASVLKSCCSNKKAATEMLVKKSSKENEHTLTPCGAVKPITTSTESLSDGCILKKMVESLATKECVEGSSQAPSIPSLKDMTPEQFACFICLLQEDKKKLEKVVAAMEQDVKDKDGKIASLQGDKEELEKFMAVMELGAKEKDNEIASIQGDKEDLKKVVAALEHSVKVKDKEIALLKSENSRLKSVSDDRGPLLNVYTWKLLKTQGFARFFKDLRTPAKSLGRHEAAEQIRDHYPAIPEEALAGLEDPLAASKLDNQFFDMIQDDGFEFPLLDHLLSLAEIPCSYQLKVLEVDKYKDALIAPQPLSAKARKNQRGSK